MKKKLIPIIVFSTLLLLTNCTQQTQSINDSNTPLHLMQPEYSTPYTIPAVDEISKVIERVYGYLEASTPTQIMDVETNTEISDFNTISSKSQLDFKAGDFRLISYEWGVSYAGMLLAGQATGDNKYTEYTNKRMQLILDLYPHIVSLEEENSEAGHPLRSVLHPHALDDAGAMCVAMIKAKQNGFEGDLDPMIENYMDYISNSQFRLEDGTLARNRPMRNSLWLDDLFMAVPALAYMGKYSNDNKYFDDAVKQVLQFSERMFNHEKGLYMHAWILGMDEHPQFHWGRANGWAVMTMIELLEVLPEDYQGRYEVLSLLKKHIRGLANYQSSQGFWHQLIDCKDSYLETSATAIYTYAIARAINRSYVDAKVYGPMVCLAWNAVASKVNTQGQVEGTCVGTGMAFDPAFYYNRPISVFAAHGYGPVLLAGAEMIELMNNTFPKMNDSAIQFYSKKIETDAPIFSVED